MAERWKDINTLDMGFRGSLWKMLALSKAKLVPVRVGEDACGRARVPVSVLGVGIHQPRLGHCELSVE